jgi:hypothetical protein
MLLGFFKFLSETFGFFKFPSKSPGHLRMVVGSTTIKLTVVVGLRVAAYAKRSTICHDFPEEKQQTHPNEKHSIFYTRRAIIKEGIKQNRLCELDMAKQSICG